MAVLRSRGSSHARLILGGSKTEWIPAPALSILKVHKGALTGFVHVYCADVLTTASLSEGCVLGTASRGRQAGYIPTCRGQGRGEEPPSAWVLGPAHVSTGSPFSLMTSPNGNGLLSVTSLTGVLRFGLKVD